MTFDFVSGGLGEGEGRAGRVRGREEEALGGAGQGKEGGLESPGGTEEPAGDFLLKKYIRDFEGIQMVYFFSQSAAEKRKQAEKELESMVQDLKEKVDR